MNLFINIMLFLSKVVVNVNILANKPEVHRKHSRISNVYVTELF